jgi:transposase
MPPRVSDDVKKLIIDFYFDDGKTMDRIAKELRVSIGLVSQTISRWLSYGTFENLFKQKAGAPPILNDGDLNYLRELYTAMPTMLMDEARDKLFMIRGVWVSLATISRALDKLNLPRKRISRAAAERDEELRAVWQAEMGQYEDPDMFVALDESAVDNRTPQRPYGRAPAGEPCVEHTLFIRGTRYSVLPALTRQGIIALDIVEGSVTTERFLQFLREQVVRLHRKDRNDPVLIASQVPQLNPFPGKRSVVLLDNCSIHHDDEVRDLIETQCGTENTCCSITFLTIQR